MRSPSGHGWQREPRDDFPLSEVVYILWGHRVLVAGIGLAGTPRVASRADERSRLRRGGGGEPGASREAGSATRSREDFVEEVQGRRRGDGWLRAVMRRAGWEADIRAFRERFDLQTVSRGDETVMLVRFSASEPEQAARASNAYAELFVERPRPSTTGQLAMDAVMERRAPPPDFEHTPLALRGGSGSGGGAGGDGGALLLEGRTRSWRDARDAELTLRAPVLGVIPDYSSVGEGRWPGSHERRMGGRCCSTPLALKAVLRGAG